MNIIITILVIVAGIIALLLIAALFIRKQHFVQREIIINAPAQKVFDYVKLLQNQEKFNKWAAADADRKKEFKGTDGTVGFIFAWSGNKSAGEGEKEIINLIEGKRVESEIRFVKPMRTTANIIMDLEGLPGNQTKITWSNGGKLKYPMNLFVPMMEKKLPADMDESLLQLKNILENNPGD